MQDLILAGDVGGTNVRLGLFRADGDKIEPVISRVFPAGDYKSLTEVAGEFLDSHHSRVERACFGVAGPVQHRRSEISNLGWVVDAGELEGELGISTVLMSNDLQVNAYGIASLEPNDLVFLNLGDPDAGGNEALISAGTGLGEAGLHWEDNCYRPIASEGGHVDFAPRNEIEVELLLYLLKRFEHVSYERLLSGPGLLNICEFLRDTGRAEEPHWLRRRMQEDDPPRVISELGLEKKCELCVRALDLFVSIYGAEAGNLALKVVATAGVFIGGGIAPKIIRKLKGSSFMEAFVAKGRMKGLLERIPVRVIMNDKTALLGAARLAAEGTEQACV